MTLPDGTTATRRTHRTYSHVVAVRIDLDLLDRQLEEAIANLEGYVARENWSREEADRSIAQRRAQVAASHARPWTVYSWASRLDLAEKAVSRARAEGEGDRFAEVRILEVDPR